MKNMTCMTISFIVFFCKDLASMDGLKVAIRCQLDPCVSSYKDINKRIILIQKYDIFGVIFRDT